ncbi:MAG: exodeoxyribonuclease VII large subunit [Anaerolineae bacterium]|nr:exodeoxyribonuclease VII large subunit [Anaerolineae bacterium]
MQPKSVTEVTRYIKSLIDSSPELADIWIEGEISNFTRAASGHCYFTLKDSYAVIQCVMWRNVAMRLRWVPQQGDLVNGFGSVSVYERGGAYQFYVEILERGGIGLRWQQFLELKARLEDEGLFATERKRPLPLWPRRIGVVTSPTGAALRDILNVLKKRYPLVEVVLSPSLVQGEEAPEALVGALELLYRVPDVDVIIIARGGGSLEDLWAFNDERVARAISVSPVPVVSGVGHETDVSIADFVADLRTPTPSTAAAAVVPDREELRARIAEHIQTLTDLVMARLERARELLQHQERALELSNPLRRIAQERQQIDEWTRRLRQGIWHQIQVRRAQLDGQTARLKALAPYEVIARGYAIVQDRETGVRLTSAGQATPQQRLGIHLSDGRIDAQVEAVSRTEHSAS